MSIGHMTVGWLVWDSLVVSGDVVVVGLHLWVALSEYELRRRRAWAGAVACLVWVGGVQLVDAAGEWPV